MNEPVLIEIQKAMCIGPINFYGKVIWKISIEKYLLKKSMGIITSWACLSPIVLNAMGSPSERLACSQ
jgi:hypothetical protein